MKIIPQLFTIVFSLIAWTTSQAQFAIGTLPTPDERQKSKETWTETCKKMREDKVASIVTESQKFKKGEAKGPFAVSTKQTYDKSGQPTEMAFYSTKGKLLFVSIYEYDDQGHVVSQMYQNAKGKRTSHNEYQYSGDLLQTTKMYRGAKDGYVRRKEFAYDPLGWLLESRTFKSKKEKLIARTQCTYHEDGSKKRVERYNRKGKLTMATDYACDKAGKTVSGGKAKESNVCERFETGSDGKAIRIVEVISEDKDRYRTVTKYDERNNELERITYTIAGEINFQFVYTYNADGYMLTSERRGRGGKLEFRSAFERDAKGHATSETRQNGDGETISNLRYTYTMY